MFTATYYPRWESASTCGTCCNSEDGPVVTITVLHVTPTVTSIDPTSGPNTGTTSVTNLAGTNFISGAGAKLSRTGYADINATSVVVDSATRIICLLDLTDRKTGLWDVVVTNPDLKSGSLATGFGITISDSKSAVGATVRSLMDPVATADSLNYRFRVWGVVETIDAQSFWLDDGSGTRIKVFAPGYTDLVTGDFASATGTVDLSQTPPLLLSKPADVQEF
jgi:hypothetical protein